MVNIGTGPLPDLVPARMVNAFVYCPRLFYLEWVQRRFAENEEVRAGLLVHRAVDQERGRLTGLPDEIARATSVTLSSERLGLIARLDIVESSDGSVVPVDVKRGHLPRRGAWPSDRAQLAVAAIVLRENGYRCDMGVLYYAGSRRRLEVPIDDELVAETLRQVIELREVAQRDTAPPPLLDSPKCPRCSLVGICLPDEHHRLAGDEVRPPRRLVPAADAANPVYAMTPGSRVGVRKSRLAITLEGEVVLEVPILDCSQLVVFGGVQVSSQAVARLMREQVPILWLSPWGWFRGMTWGPYSNWVDLRMRQAARAYRGDVEPARRFVWGKIRNQRTIIRRNAKPRPDESVDRLARLARSAQRAESLQELLGIEGAAARLYFGEFAGMLKVDEALPGGTFSFEGRNRRPPRDAVNALLGFSYALLVKDLVAATMGVGFDPLVGLFHAPRFGRPALALDLAEEFRPIVGDSVVIGLINNGEIRPSDFVSRAGAVSLTQQGRRRVIEAYERRMRTEIRHPLFGYTVSYRRILEVQARLLAAFIVGETGEYRPFVTR